MSQTIVGIFNTREEAENAMNDLRAAGYPENEISLVAKDSNGTSGRTSRENVDDSKIGEGAAIGAATGAVATAAVGAGIMAGVIPVIGPVLAMGPIAVTLLNAASGAAVAGVAGALIGAGVTEDDAKYYEGEVKNGRFVVFVDWDDKLADPRGIYSQNKGYDRTGIASSRV